MTLYSRCIQGWERRLTLRDTNRCILPFSWGTEWLGTGDSNGNPLESFQEHTRQVLSGSDEFFRPPPLSDFRLEDDRLTFPTPTPTPDPPCNTVHGRLFPAPESKAAVIVVPQWNADSNSHVALCRILQKLGLTALRLTLPYHEDRAPGMKRADHMVSPNIGRTLHANRQAVLETRQLAGWLHERGYQRIGVVGTSIGSCVAYLAFVHEPLISTAVFNHVSAFFADVVWTGLSTRYVRWGLEHQLTLEELRQCWAPISPYYFIPRLRGCRRPHLLISARYDLTFLPSLSNQVFRCYEENQLECDRAVLPCGHYTTAKFPFVWLDGWHICRYLHKHLVRSAVPRQDLGARCRQTS